MTDDEKKAAELAGWDFSKGDPPFTHTLPPPVDPELGNNGIKPTEAKVAAQ